MASHHNDSLQWVYDKSMVSLKTEDPKSCYLHSHPFMYEGHENQQQVGQNMFSRVLKAQRNHFKYGITANIMKVFSGRETYP